MSMELIGIISVGVAVSALLKSFINGLREDMKNMEARLREDTRNMEMRLRDDLKQLGERVARLEHGQAKLEGLLEGLREAVAGRSVAQLKDSSSSIPVAASPSE